MSCARHTTRNNPTSPIVISVLREKNVEQVIHCYMSTLQCVLESSRDFSLPRVWSVSRTISPHHEDLQALTTGGTNFRAFLPIPNVLPDCDAPRIRINREMTLQRRRQLSPHVPMNSCFALRIVSVWELWRLLAVCPPSRTADASNFRIVWFSELSDTSHLMPPLGYTCAFEKKECLLLLKLCWNPISPVPFVLVWRSLVLRLPLCLLCERHPQRLRQRLVEWLSPLALGTHVCSFKLESKPHLRFTCFSPGHVEIAATSYSRPTWDIVDHIHKDTTAYSDEHNRLWTRPYHVADLMNEKIENENMTTVSQLPCLLN